MAENQKVHHCRIYRNGGSRSIHIPRPLADMILECFPPDDDYNIVFDPNKELLTIFKPVPPA